jgi:SPP1 family predicted phage head-tail adaptor
MVAVGVNAGQMDREISLETATKTQDPSSGEEIITWAGEIIWARWLPAGTREAWQAQQRLSAFVDGVFHIYDKSPRPTPEGSRVVFDGRIYDVKGVVEIGRGEGLELDVVARGETP